MIQDALQTQAEAEGKLQRAKLSFDTTADMQRGSAAMVGLRKLYEAANGNDFQLMEFHVRAIVEGALPMRLLGANAN